MSVFDQPGVYARNPRGGVEHITDLIAAGFKWYAFNVGDYSETEWGTVIERCRNHGMDVFPWQMVWSDADVRKLCSMARTAYGGKVIVNAEAPLDDGRVSMEEIADQTKGMDAAVSTLCWPFNDEDWMLVKHCVIQAQLFPQENETSKKPRDCRAQWVNRGLTRIHFMYGMHGMTADQFPPRQYAYSIYTVDDMGFPPNGWSPESFPPLDPDEFPKVAPGYGPGAGKPQSKKSLMWKALKRAMHRAGYGTFDVPDDVFNQKLKASLVAFQASTAISDPTGAYGTATYEALLTLQALEVPGYAMDAQACEWARQAKAAGDPQPM